MTLKQKINQELIEALKSKDELKSSVLRMAKSSIKNKEIALGKELDEATLTEVIVKEIKQRKEAAVEYRKGQRPELAEKEEKETEILSQYLPEQLSEEEVMKIVEAAIAKTNASTPQDMGKVMGMIMPELKGKADGSLISKLVKEKLSE